MRRKNRLLSLTGREDDFISLINNVCLRFEKANVREASQEHNHSTTGKEKVAVKHPGVMKDPLAPPGRVSIVTFPKRKKAESNCRGSGEKERGGSVRTGLVMQDMAQGGNTLLRSHL